MLLNFCVFLIVSFLSIFHIFLLKSIFFKTEFARSSFDSKQGTFTKAIKLTAAEVPCFQSTGDRAQHCFNKRMDFRRYDWNFFDAWCCSWRQASSTSVTIMCRNDELSWTMTWVGCLLTTLYFYNNEPSKNKHFLILLSSLARNSQEPRLKRIFEILWVLF